MSASSATATMRTPRMVAKEGDEGVLVTVAAEAYQQHAVGCGHSVPERLGGERCAGTYGPGAAANGPAR